MPSRFEKYRFTKKTVLSDETFNNIWRDIDLRLANLEDTQKDWESAVRQLTELGLSRIENALLPAFQHIQTKREQAEELVSQIQTLRQNADSMINASRDEVIAQINGAKQEALSQIQQVKDQAVSQTNQTKQDALSEINQARDHALSQIQQAASELSNIWIMSFFFGGE